MEAVKSNSAIFTRYYDNIPDESLGDSLLRTETPACEALTQKGLC
jgi:hypothetical protein